jgi:serine/threonine-protein kinase
MLGYYSFLPPAEALPKAKAAASGALQRDETLAEAHAALAFSRMFYDWDFNAAEKEFKRALELQPDYAIACYWYGLNLAALGRPYEAVEHVRRAQELDPLSPIINTYVAGAYYFARRYDQAIQKCRETLELGLDFAPARLVLGWAYRQKSMFQEAVVEFRKAKRSSPASADALAAIGHTFAVWGKRGEANAALEDLKKKSRKSYVSPGHFAMIHLGLGDKDAAFDWLDKACAERYAWLVFLKVDPIFDCLSSDPRFATLAGKIGLV